MMNNKQFNKLQNEYRAYRRVYNIHKNNFNNMIDNYIKSMSVVNVDMIKDKLNILRELYREYSDIEDKYNFELNCRKEG